jgi:hypothetical protein
VITNDRLLRSGYRDVVSRVEHIPVLAWVDCWRVPKVLLLLLVLSLSQRNLSFTAF